MLWLQIWTRHSIRRWLVPNFSSVSTTETLNKLWLWLCTEPPTSPLVSHQSWPCHGCNGVASSHSLTSQFKNCQYFLPSCNDLRVFSIIETLVARTMDIAILIFYYWSCQHFSKTVSFPFILDKPPPVPASHRPDPFVKIFLLPDKTRKRKTEFVKESLNPVWEESFNFTVPRDQLKEKRLMLVVMDRKGLFLRYLGHLTSSHVANKIKY